MGNKHPLPAGPEIGIYATCDPESEPYRRNLPEEEWLVALCGKALAACQAALRAHQRSECADCDCELLADMRGLEFNLELSVAGIGGQLVTEDSIDALGPVIDRLARLVPARNLPEEDCLLRTLELLLAACDVVEQRHDAAAADGRCYCNLCLDIFGLRYNTRTAHDLIGGALRSIDTPEELLTCLSGEREYQRAEDGPGCPCYFCTVATEALRAFADANGHRAAPAEPAADAPVAFVAVAKPLPAAGNPPGHDGPLQARVPSPPRKLNYWEAADR
jgi:hypothetical protein